MRKLTSTKVLGAGFGIVLALLVYSAAEAFRLQRAGGEELNIAYRRFSRQDDAITAVRRTIWLGGIYAREYFLDRSPGGRERFVNHLDEIEHTGLQYMNILREAAPARAAELTVEGSFHEFILELRQLTTPGEKEIPAPAVLIEEVLIPRRLALLALFEEFRVSVRQELVAAQTRYDADRSAAARTLAYLLAAALIGGILVAVASIRYAARLDRERQSHYEAISLANLELENLSARLLEIQEQERRTLSQELHDEVGQTLTALRMEISQAISQVPESATRERLVRARQLAEDTVQIVRDISLMLRPSLLDDLGLGPALQWQLERFSSRSGIDCRFDGAEIGETLPDSVKTCVFRIAQETLNNCEKYAGASTVRVILRHAEGRVSLEVRDDGRGVVLDHRGLPSRGTGILGMKERAQKLGGTLIVESAPGEGTRVALVLPVESPVPEPAVAR